MRVGLRVLRRARRGVPRSTSTSRPMPRRATSATSPWAWCSRSCRGTSPSGRCSGFAAPALDGGQRGACSSTPPTSPGARWPSSASSREAGVPDGLVHDAAHRSATRPREVIRDPARTPPSPSPAAPAPVGRWRPRPASVLKKACSSSAAATLRRTRGRRPRAAADACVTSRFINSGQSCIAAKRFIVVEAVRERVRRERVSSRMERGADGRPRTRTPTSGRMARVDLRDGLHDQVETQRAAGAQAWCSAARCRTAPGAWYPPTRARPTCAPGMPAFDEEMFGPVAAVIAARDECHAHRARQRTRRTAWARRCSPRPRRGRADRPRALDAGILLRERVRASPTRACRSAASSESGYGRELGAHGIREFVNAKTLYLA